MKCAILFRRIALSIVFLGLVYTTVMAQKADVDTIVITGRIVEIPGKFAPNDLYNYVYIMKYRVLSVVKGNYSEKEILVGHYNPLIPRKNLKDKMASVVKGDADKFEIGVKHKLVLITPIDKVWNDAIDDEYIDSKLTKYFAIQTDIAK